MTTTVDRLVHIRTGFINPRGRDRPRREAGKARGAWRTRRRVRERRATPPADADRPVPGPCPRGGCGGTRPPPASLLLAVSLPADTPSSSLLAASRVALATRLARIYEAGSHAAIRLLRLDGLATTLIGAGVHAWRASCVSTLAACAPKALLSSVGAGGPRPAGYSCRGGPLRGPFACLAAARAAWPSPSSSLRNASPRLSQQRQAVARQTRPCGQGRHRWCPCAQAGAPAPRRPRRGAARHAPSG